MKAMIKLPIFSPAKILVEVGDKFDAETVLAEAKLSGQEKIIPLAKLLHVNPSLIHRYLKKMVGEKVNLGDLLAERKSFFSTSFVKSPYEGKIKEIDLKKGTLTFHAISLEEGFKITLPVSGKIAHLDKEYIEVEVEGKVLKSHKGSGAETVGNLAYLLAETVGIFDVLGEVDKCIVLGREFNEETVVKLEVLGTKGLISQKALTDTSLPWVQVEEEVFKTLAGDAGKKIWLRPKEKQIIII